MNKSNAYFNTKTPIFTPSRNFHNRYLVAKESFTTKVKHKIGENIALPLVIDSEYYAPNVHDLVNDTFCFRRPVTVQVKHTHHPETTIYAHDSFKREADEQDLVVRHPVTQHPFIVGDYLEDLGHTISFERVSDYEELVKHEPRPKMVVVLYAYFALADIGMVCPEPDYQIDVSKKISSKNIKMTRRLVCGKKGSGKTNMPWFITIDGFEYQISLQIVDACAIHGIASYKEFCANSNVVLDDKDLMGDDIKRMDKVYYERPEDFDAYSLGDLKVYDALESNAENMKTIWNELGIGDYYRPPPLSIGATVSELFKYKLYQLFDITPEQAVTFKNKDRDIFLEDLTYKASPIHLQTLVNSNAFTLVKCDGGRCKNNNPITTSVKGDLVDIDISGAYSSAMSGLPFALGNPVIYATKYKRNTKGAYVQKGVPLKAVLSTFGSELLDDLWYCRVNTENLAYEQDLIGSWSEFKRTLNRQSDTDLFDGEVDVTSGFTKIFTKEIHNGCLTSDVLEVVNQWTPRQRDDFYEKTEVIAIAFYPKSLRVDLETFKTTRPDKRFSTRAKGLKAFDLITPDNHTWTSFNMGEFFTDIFRAKRVTHAKKTPLNTLFKLMGNTAYGCAVSRFFLTSNMIFANQITAKCRAKMYMTEKALNLHGSITDGQVFNINKVLHRTDRPLKTEYLTRLYAVTKTELNWSKAGKFAPLNLTDDSRHVINNDTYIKYQSILKNAKRDEHGKFNHPANDEKTIVELTRIDSIMKKLIPSIDIAALEHVRKVWTGSNLLNGTHKRLDVSGKSGRLIYIESTSVFDFEMKEFTELLVVQGSSNYSFDPADKGRTKFRSYEGRAEHLGFEIDSDVDLVVLDTYEKMNPAQVLLNEIHKNPHHVKRLPPFIKTGILKATAYAAGYRSTWYKSPLQAGDNVLKIGRPAYFSTSQFTYQTAEQYDKWKKSGEKLKRKYGESYEIFFSNIDGTINYQGMLETIDKMIRDGIINPLSIFDPHNHLSRTVLHHSIKTIQETISALRVKVSKSMAYDNTPEDDDWEFIDTEEGYE